MSKGEDIMFKLALTAGHYMGTPGKRCLKSLDPKETREWWLNNRIADQIESMLAEYEGISILRTDDTTGQKEVELEDRVSAANKFDADFYLSIHHNAGANGTSAGGIVNYVYTNGSKASHEWSKELYNELIKLTGLKGNRTAPLATANFYEIKYTNMPAVLLELGFMDSKTDVPVILTDSYAKKCAEACVNVIVKRAKLNKKSIQQPTPAPTPVATAVLEKGSKSEKVERLQNLLNLLGYYCGNSDGIFGTNTENAVKKFQSDNKIGTDGIYGPKSDMAMRKALTSTSIILRKNYNKSNQVIALQEIISDYGYDCGNKDGIYGDKTVSCVENFQRSRGLNADGIVGPKTISKFVDYLKL